MTENEAKTKKCPIFSSVGLLCAAIVGGGADKFKDGIQCSGSACMMWRWGKHVEGKEAGGYCGLACKP